MTEHPRHILVTGASGLLGINLALEASARHRVTGVVHDRALAGVPFDVVRTDLLRPGAAEGLVSKAGPDWIIHCAALARVDQCESSPDLARRLNTEVPASLARASAECGARFMLISTDSVFDGRRGGYTEDDEPQPVNVYGRTKLDGEREVMAVCPDAIVARVNFFGWSLTGKRSLAEWFYNNLSRGVSVGGFTDAVFCPLLATDLAGILLRMLEGGLRGLFHVVSSEGISKCDFGVELARSFGFDERLVRPKSIMDGGLTAARGTTMTLRTDKLSRALGFSLPGPRAGLSTFHDQCVRGYPERLRAMAACAQAVAEGERA